MENTSRNYKNYSTCGQILQASANAAAFAVAYSGRRFYNIVNTVCEVKCMQDTVMMAKMFFEVFGAPAEKLTFAPGRVNLIGEHTDYNGGHVLPCALGVGALCAARKRSDRLIRFYSLNMPDKGIIEYSLDDIAPLGSFGWASYPMGVMGVFRDGSYPIEHGADIMLWGDVPSGAGLSSSAALEAATALMLCVLYGFEVEPVQLAVMCRAAENKYVGVNCGIMDQFASVMGLAYSYAPLEMKGAEIVIVNSNVKHSLAGSAYNDRRRECEQALAALKEATGAQALCHITPEAFEANAHLLPDPVLYKRAKHAVYEEARTKAAIAALSEGDLTGFGRLMNASHISLRDDYEVSCRELDVLTELAWQTRGVIGARMTGGGFGGCMVCIVDKACVPAFIERVGSAYYERTGLTAEFYEAYAGDGARELRL